MGHRAKVDLASEILIESLRDMLESGDVSIRRIEAQSDTSNISRVLSGDLKPTHELWRKLHVTFPTDIPDLVYIDGNGSVVNQHVESSKGGVVQAGRDITGNVHHASPTHRIAYELLSQVDEKTAKEIVKILAEKI